MKDNSTPTFVPEVKTQPLYTFAKTNEETNSINLFIEGLFGLVVAVFATRPLIRWLVLAAKQRVLPRLFTALFPFTLNCVLKYKT